MENPYVIGIVGSEAAKFTAATEAAARRYIRALLLDRRYWKVVSGACHLGGVDRYAIEEAAALGLAVEEFPATAHQWGGPDGYAARNRRIASTAHDVVCVTVKALPAGYTGMRFRQCYHCGTDAHVKSGGCWTVKQAKLLGRRAWVEVIG